MSIKINKNKCVGCKRCVEVCPGNLIKIDENGKATIRSPLDCWGCTSCLKECHVKAIEFFLGEDIGGKGSTLSYHEKTNIVTWSVTSQDEQRQIVIDKTQSNKY